MRLFSQPGAFGGGLFSRGGVFGRQSAGNSPTIALQANLFGSVVPEIGTGAFTYENAGTETFTNEAGDTITGSAGEVVFDQMQRIENVLTYSEDISNAAWSTVGAPAATKTNIGTHEIEVFNPVTNRTETRLMTVWEITGFDDAAGWRLHQAALGSDDIENEVFTAIACMWTDAAGDGLRVQFAVRAESSSTGQKSRNITLTRRPTLYNMSNTFTGAAAQTGVRCGIIKLDAIETVYVAFMQCQRITGQASITPGGYVPTTSAPAVVYVPFAKRVNVSADASNLYETIFGPGAPVGDLDPTGRYMDELRNVGTMASPSKAVLVTEGGATPVSTVPTAFPVHYIDAAATGAANGTSWADAWNTLTEAQTDGLGANETVIVRAGDYFDEQIVLDDLLDVRFRAEFPDDPTLLPRVGYTEDIGSTGWSLVTGSAWAGGPHSIADIVTHSGSTWFSRENSNTEEPGTGAKWEDVTNVYEKAFTTTPRYLATTTKDNLGIRRAWDNGTNDDPMSPQANGEWAQNTAKTTIYVYSDAPVAGPAPFNNIYYGVFSGDSVFQMGDAQGVVVDGFRLRNGSSLAHFDITSGASSDPYNNNACINSYGSFAYAIMRNSVANLGYFRGLRTQNCHGEDMGACLAMYGGANGFACDMIDSTLTRGGLSESWGGFYQQQGNTRADKSAESKYIYNCDVDTYTKNRYWNDGAGVYSDQDGDGTEAWFCRIDNVAESAIRSNCGTGMKARMCWGSGNGRGVRISDGDVGAGVQFDGEFLHFTECVTYGLETLNTGSSIAVALKNCAFHGAAGSAAGIIHQNDTIISESYVDVATDGFTDDLDPVGITVTNHITDMSGNNGFAIPESSACYQTGSAVDDMPAGAKLDDFYLSYPVADLFVDTTDIGNLGFVLIWTRENAVAGVERIISLGNGGAYFEIRWLGSTLLRVIKDTNASALKQWDITIPNGAPKVGEQVRIAMQFNTLGIQVAIDGVLFEDLLETDLFDATDWTTPLYLSSSLTGAPAVGQGLYRAVRFWRGRYSNNVLRAMTA